MRFNNGLFAIEVSETPSRLGNRNVKLFMYEWSEWKEVASFSNFWLDDILKTIQSAKNAIEDEENIFFMVFGSNNKNDTEFKLCSDLEEISSIKEELLSAGWVFIQEGKTTAGKGVSLPPSKYRYFKVIMTKDEDVVR
jgi:hypothetical protein